MDRSFTHRNAYRKTLSWFTKAFVLLLLSFIQAGTLSAHTVDYFSSCGYVCAGSTVTVNAHLSATNSNTNYNWQFRDNSGVWKCFNNGNNTINGVTFSVSGATAKGQLTAAPTLNITNATTALTGVDLRIVMADGTNASPCASNPSYSVYGTDKSLELHVLTGNDCSNIAIYCAGGTPPTTCGTGKFSLSSVVNGFNVFAEDALTLNNGHVDGAVAAGGNVKLDGATTVAMNNPGDYPNGASNANNYGLVIGGGINYVSGGQSKIINGYLRLGSTTGSKIWTTDPNGASVNLRVTSSAQSGWSGYNSNPALQLQRTESSSTATSSSGLNFTTAFNSLSSYSSAIASYTSSSTAASQLNIINISSSSTVSVTLVDGKINVINLTGTQLKNLSKINFVNQPSATRPLVFNVNQTANITWTSFQTTGIANSNGQYVLYNFYNLAGSLVLDGANLTFGTILSPDGSVTWNNSNNLEGSIIAKTVLICNGEIHDQPFYPCLPECSPTGNLRLGNQVWNDFDGDGKRDDNEPGIPGATISLYTDNNSDNLPDGAAIRTTTSDSLGHYLFTNLPAGRYIASMPILPGYQKSPNTSTPATSPLPDNNIDNDNNLVRLVGANGPGGVVYTNAVTLSANGEPTTDGDDANGNLTFDLAQCGNSFIGDFVWKDLNGNGIQDAGEPGINGVTVTITFSDGRTATTTTLTYNAANNLNVPQFDGYYNFPNLGPGTYKITFSTPAGLIASPNNAGTNDAKDSDPVNGAPVTVTLTANQSNFTIDAGFYVKPIDYLTLGNQVWNDFDGDGKRDDNEPGIPGVTISLYTDNDGNNLPDGPAIKTTVTDALGQYKFTNLTEGRYIASMPILPGYQKTPNTTTEATSPFPDNNVDDDNNLVRLVGPNGPGGIMYTNAITLTANQEPTSDGDDANGNNTFDLAECGNSFIGDFVWNDYNGNGIQDAGEPGINGAKVTITFSDGTTATTTTATYNAANNLNTPQFDGYYNFPNLGPGTYKITFATPAGLHASPSNAGDDTKDSDPVNGAPVTVTLVANQSNFTIDAGFTAFIAPPPTTCPNLSIGNMVFNDVNGNGVKDATEQGIGGLTVKLYADNNGNNAADGAAISTLMTADDGTYYFGNLAAGKYIVGVTTGTGYTQDTFGDTTPDDNKDNDNNGIKTVNGEVFSNAITLSAGDEPINDGSDNNSNLTLDFGLKVVVIAPCTNHCECKNDCTHTGCGHANCGHNSCKNDCTHTGCGHANCGKSDITGTTVNIFPNPARDYCTLKVDAAKSGVAEVRVTDGSGQFIISKTITLAAGVNSMTFNDLGKLNSGIYNIQILFNYHVYNQQLVLVN